MRFLCSSHRNGVRWRQGVVTTHLPPPVLQTDLSHLFSASSYLPAPPCRNTHPHWRGGGGGGGVAKKCSDSPDNMCMQCMSRWNFIYQILHFGTVNRSQVFYSHNHMIGAVWSHKNAPLVLWDGEFRFLSGSTRNREILTRCGEFPSFKFQAYSP